MSDICNAVNKFGKGVGNESRYRIVQALCKGPRTVSELVRLVKQTQPAVSQHLKTLKEAEIVVDERQGQEVYYSLNSEHILALLSKLALELKPNAKK